MLLTPDYFHGKPSWQRVFATPEDENGAQNQSHQPFSCQKKDVLFKHKREFMLTLDTEDGQRKTRSSYFIAGNTLKYKLI